PQPIASSHPSRSSRATSSDTSSDQPSPVLKPTTRTGFLYCPLSGSEMTASRLDIGLAIGAAQVAEIIQHEIHRLIIVTVRHNRRGPSRPRHQSNSTPQNQQ